MRPQESTEPEESTLNTRDLPTGRSWVLILTAVLCGAAATSIAAQQSPDQAGTAGISPAQTSAPAESAIEPSALTASAPQPSTSVAGTAQAGPRVTPRFESYEPSMPGTSATTESNARSGQHTIVLSTLALVLVVVIIVLLAVD